MQKNSLTIVRLLRLKMAIICYAQGSWMKR